jgi:hypothetical protein
VRSATPVIWTLLLLPATSLADTDALCMRDCTSKGYLYGVCENQCRTSPQSGGAQFYPPPINPPPDMFAAYQRGQQAAQQSAIAAEQLRAAQLENERRAAELRAAQQQEHREAAQSGAGANVPTEITPAQTRFLDAIKYRRFRWADFDAVAFAPDVPMTEDMIGLMAESRYAADIAYYLGKNKGRAAQISAMTLPDAAAAIKDIESQLARQPP